MSRTIMTTILFLLALSITTFGLETPGKINFQGYLADSGEPLNGDYEITFRIYNVDAGGTPLWVETRIVTVTQGLYSEPLGSIALLDFEFTGELYLGVEIVGQSEMTPRYQLMSVPFAMASRVADSARTITVDGIDSVRIKDKSVSLNDLNGGGASTGQTIKWTGLEWAPSDDLNGGGGGGGWSDDGNYVRLATSSDSVGIGTANPEYELDVVGSVQISNNLIVGDSHWVYEGDYGTIAGGRRNKTEEYGFIGGGYANTIGAPYSAVVGGAENYTLESYSFVGGGKSNAATKSYSTVAGGNYNYVYSGYSTICGGDSNGVWSNYGFVGGGKQNWADSAYSAVLGGHKNTAMGNYASVGGGQSDSAKGDYSFIGSGFRNISADSFTVVSGGLYNHAYGDYSFIGTGDTNKTYGDYSVITGGRFGETHGMFNFIGNGYSNQTADSFAVICSGDDNYAWRHGFVGSGRGNTALDEHATVVNGSGNDANSIMSFIGNGMYNKADSNYSTIVNGRENEVNAHQAFIGIGMDNVVDSAYSVIVGGRNNVARGPYAFIGGGSSNFAYGTCSAIPGGGLNSAEGDYSMAAGRLARADHDNSFVWSDGSGYLFTSADDQFLIYASGGVGIGTNSPESPHLLHVNGLAKFNCGGGSIAMSTPGGWPGVIAFSSGGNRRDIIFQDNAMYIVAGTSGSGPGLTEGITIASGGDVGIKMSPVAPYELDVNGDIRCATLTQTSDVRLKKNIKNIDNALSRISKMRGVTFDWNQSHDETRELSDDHQIGLIAQEVEKVFPELVSSSSDGYKAVQYSKLTAVLLEAIKELKNENDELKQRLDALESQ